MVEALSPVHLIGIGGAGMSALATVMLERGLSVGGSDMKESQGLAGLRALGARVAVGHDAANLGDAATVVVSSAIRDTNPELRAAHERGIPVLHRAQLLAALMRGRRGIAVSGTHGKTTTTSMITLALERAGLDPSFLIGGELNERGTNAHHGAGEWLVAEADESDGSLLWLAPEIAVVTNIEAEHLDHYRDLAEIEDTFAAFLANTPDHGLIVVGADDPGAVAVASRTGRRTATFGLHAGEWRGIRRVKADAQEVAVERGGEPVGVVRLRAPGAHNARNALAAITVADACGVAFQDAAAALATFEGPRRRFQYRGTAAGVRVVDDYAHHPTEIAAALNAARETHRGRVIAVFQPHLYSRTVFLGSALGAALSDADVVVVTDVYGQREDPIPGVTGRIVVDGALQARPRAWVAYLPRRGDITTYLAERAHDGDLVLTIGAGDITMLGDDILRRIQERAGR